MMSIRSILRRIYWLLGAQFGIYPLKTIRSLQGLPKYVRDFLRFRSRYKGRLEFLPCLHDWYEEGGTTSSEYFWQDLLVARKIFEAQPEKHVDVGSRFDGFVAHVASFREIEVFDVRPVTTQVPGVIFRQADLMEPVEEIVDYCDSLSCLHALEHFGLGRYGDPINPQGYQHGIANMGQLLKLGGTFYLSTPIGQERVEFNANWVFDPRSIVQCAQAAGMTLQKLIVITPAKGPQESLFDSAALADLSLQRYQLGLFVFTKTNH
jgi:hypothetical protein